MLARYGFAGQVEAPGAGAAVEARAPGPGREVRGLDTGAELAAEALGEVFIDHEAAQFEDWMRRSSRAPA